MNKMGETQATNETQGAQNKNRKGVVKWLKRIGVAGFLFFLIKGILWLTVGAAVLRYIGCES